MSRLKTLALQMMLLPGAETLFAPFARGRGIIFMLHRFRSPENPDEGYDTFSVRRALGHLRRAKYNILSIEQLLRAALEEGRVPNRSVAFTIDDGYLDHATVAGPLFAEFDCPVTTFVTSGFLDGTLWFWWDRIAYAFASTRRSSLGITLGTQQLEYRWESVNQRAMAQGDFTERCKQVPDEEKHGAIARLAAVLEVDLPDQPPPRYAPMSWAQLRECERRGMSFGPHTVTHPVLSRVTDDRSRWELEESWSRLQSEAAAPVPVFCYPNGRPGDFSKREMTTLQRLGFLGAVVGWDGFVSARSTRLDANARFNVRRFPYPDDLPHLVQFVSGAECAKALLRGEVA